MTIYDAIFNNAVFGNNDIALVEPLEQLSYSNLNEKIKKFTNWLLQFEKCNILLLLHNSIEFVVSFFAITQAGHTVIIADPALVNEMDYIVNKLQVSIIVGENNQNRKLRFEKVEYIEKSRIDDLIGETSKSRYINSDDICVILCTSGVTGKPKMVMNSHRNLIAALRNYTSTVNFKIHQRMLAAIPFFHSYGLGSCMLAGLYCGCTIYIHDNFNPKTIMRIIKDNHIEIFHGVPFMYAQLIKHYDGTKNDLSSLAFCVSAGGAIEENVLIGFNKLIGQVIHQEYGSTETGTISINLSNELDEYYISVGRALNGVDVITKKIDGIERIFIRSKGCAKGYIGENPFENEWYDTGDIGYISEQYIYITGRVGRLIEISGKKIDPYEIENALLCHPYISEVCVDKLSNDYGDILVAYVISNVDISYQEIVSFCKNKIATYKIPKVIKRIERLPKNELGKVCLSNGVEL